MMINLLAESNFEGSDIYFGVAVFSTVIFAGKFLLMMLGGDADAADTEFDVEMDGSADAHDIQHDSTGAFTLFSIQSILAFMMGMGWIGYFAIAHKGYESGTAFSMSFGAGVVLMVFQSLMLMQVKKLEHIPKFDLGKTIGTQGRVYLKIPSAQSGSGKVEVNVHGRRQVIDAVTKGDEIESFRNVRIVEVIDGGKLLVELV